MISPCERRAAMHASLPQRRGPLPIPRQLTSIHVILMCLALSCQADGDEFSCELGYFRCGDLEQCVAQVHQCDQEIHCQNGADEDKDACIYVGKPYILADNFTKPTLIAKDLCHLLWYPRECECVRGDRLQCLRRGLTRVPMPLPTNASRLYLQDNNITEIASGLFERMGKLELIHLARNKITVLRNGTFKGLVGLEKLIIADNGILRIEEGAFSGLTNLMWLFLQGNKLRAIDGISTLSLPSLEWLNLDHNNLTLAGSTNHPWPASLIMLSIERNRIRQLEANAFSRTPKLAHLVLEGNGIKYVDSAAFSGLNRLGHLNLTNNAISYLDDRTFIDNINLKVLYLNFNPIQRIPEALFRPLKQLDMLMLEGIVLDNINAAMFKPMENLQFVNFSSFSYCRYVPQVRVCYPKTDGISSLDNLLDMFVLRVCIWVVAILTCLGNFLVILARLIFRDENRVHSLFIKNLCAADFLMGVYLLIVACQDVKFRDAYNANADAWMSSWGCQVTGYLSMISSEVSVLILTYMSVERYVTITHPYKMIKLSMPKAVISIVLIWSLGTVIAIIPMLSSQTFGAFYGSNGVCFPLHIHEPYMKGWQYSAFVFLFLNSASMIIICYCYMSMFVSIQKTRKETNAALSSDTNFAKRFFVIVLTDALCWIPIIIVKILAFSGIQISGTLYAWIAILVLPVNSAINPIVYSLTTVAFRRKMTDILSRKGRRFSRNINAADNAYQWFNSSNNSRSSTQITSMDVSADVAVALIVSPSNFSKVKDDHMKAREPGHTVSARPGDATCALTEVMS